MGTKATLTAADGFRLNAYRADPAGPVRGGVVMIQEIFGVNHHIRSVCDRLADAGYRAMAPQVFDRIETNFESGYTDPERTRAREFAGRVDWAKMMLDASAAVDALKREGPVAIMGFCMGGTVAFVASTRLGGLAASICYYGGRIVRYADNKPRCPVQMHFGQDDEHISMNDVQTIRQKRPECEIHVYPDAGHGFHCDERQSYNLRSAKIAWQRSLALLSRVFASAKSRPAAVGPNPVPASAAKSKAKPRKSGVKRRRKAAVKSTKSRTKPKKISKPARKSKPRR
jgi:carboxymethylenebutenolidase